MEASRGLPPPSEGLRRDLLEIHRAALRAADPERILERDLRGDAVSGWTFRGRPLLPPLRTAGEPVFLFGAGKAAAALARGVRRGLAGEDVRGRVIVKHGHRLEVPGVVVEEAGHPVPDADSVEATKRLLGDLRASGESGRVLVLLTGGASALLVAPAAGITPEDKSRVSSLLLACGADIHEINTVRKHLSAVKGGGLIPLLPPGRAAALVISDVIGDQLTSIGSGPATGDPTTFGDALGVLEKFDLTERVPEAVLHRFRDGVAGAVAETPAAPPRPCPTTSWPATSIRSARPRRKRPDAATAPKSSAEISRAGCTKPPAGSRAGWLSSVRNRRRRRSSREVS